MLDVRKPLGLLFIILGALLYLYGTFFTQPVDFQTPVAHFPLKLNLPVGAFMFVFGLVMWQLARFVELHTLDRELRNRESELAKAERRRQKALAKQKASQEGESSEDAEDDADAVAESEAEGVVEALGDETGSEKADSSKPKEDGTPTEPSK